MYKIPATPINGEVAEFLFTGTDKNWHDRQRRLVNTTMTNSTLIKFEPWVDDVIRAFCKQVEVKFAETGALMDLMVGSSSLAFDAGTLSFG